MEHNNFAAVGWWLALLITTVMAVLVLTSCTSILEPEPATYEVDCSDPFNAPMCPVDLGDVS